MGFAALGALALAAAPALSGITSAGAQAVQEPIVVQFDEVGTSAFTVPADVHCVAVDAVGAAGGGASASFGEPGNGGETIATIGVTPGSALQVNVGGIGGNANGITGGDGGFNGGAAGGTVGSTSGAGGGGGGG